jgi:2,4-dienoyl-CoA reductase-like NADH-dependent reductase (Old Yellow Enzyme family)
VDYQTLTSGRTPERFSVVSAEERKITTRDPASRPEQVTMFDPVEINSVLFRNRLVRSSIGGRTAFYDGTVSDAYAHFEKRFALHGIGALISPTLTVDDDRWSPLQYPRISRDEFVEPLARAIEPVQALGCVYIIQIGDPGSQTQTSLFPQAADALSASDGKDWVYGYVDRRVAMSQGQIAEAIYHFRQGARRVKATGAKGLELTISKGYLIHQFLNPQTNTRTDRYGGGLAGRYTLLGEIVREIRAEVGRNYLVGVRLSANDFNEPWFANLRAPLASSLRRFPGNTRKDMLRVAGWLQKDGIDYLHVTNGFGFINLRENPGRFPVDELRMFLNSTRHLSRKAEIRATIANLFPGVVEWAANRGATPEEEVEPFNLSDAAFFRSHVSLPVICNGGFRFRHQVAGALTSESADMISMARGLLANPNLPERFYAGYDGSGSESTRCTFCNRCAIRTTLFPIGCYDVSRFKNNVEEMEDQVIAWAKDPEKPVPPHDPAGPRRQPGRHPAFEHARLGAEPAPEPISQTPSSPSLPSPGHRGGANGSQTLMFVAAGTAATAVCLGIAFAVSRFRRRQLPDDSEIFD